MEKKKWVVLIMCAAVVCAVAIYASLMASRMQYSSEDAMREALQGQYQAYCQEKPIETHLFIDGNTVTQMHYLDGKEYPFEGEVERWDYKHGYFLANGEKYVVTRDETVKSGDTEYKKAENLLFPMQDMINEILRKNEELEISRERGENVLKVSYANIEHNSNYTVCTGSLKNNGKKTYRFIQVKGAFKDSSGNVLDTDSTYVVGSEGLSPGESSTFRLSVPKNSKIESCTVTVYDYDI